MIALCTVFPAFFAAIIVGVVLFTFIVLNRAKFKGKFVALQVDSSHLFLYYTGAMEGKQTLASNVT